MTGPGLPPVPNGNRPRGTLAPPPTGFSGPQRPFSSSHFLLLTSRPRFMRFPSLRQLLPPRLPPFRFDLYFPRRVRGGGQCRGCQGQLPRRVLVRTPRRACRVPPSQGTGYAKTTRQPDRPTDPERREGAEQARAYTSPARSGANVCTSASPAPPPRVRAPPPRLPPAQR